MSLCAGIICAPVPVLAQVNILTNRYDPQRTGANLSETILTAGNVSAAGFGKLYSYPVDGAVYAQPLYVAGVTIDGVARNVLYVATMNDKLYAFDADQPSPTPLWMRDFTRPPSVTAIPITDLVAAKPQYHRQRRYPEYARHRPRDGHHLPRRADEGERHIRAAPPRPRHRDRLVASREPRHD